MDYTKLNSMCDWERSKALFLVNVATNLNMDLTGYGEIAVNSTSGYTYLWLEDYPFTLYMPINCELSKSAVMLSWFNSDDGNEEETPLNSKTLSDCLAWAGSLQENANANRYKIGCATA